MVSCAHAFIAQWIELLRPKEEILVRFRVRAHTQNTRQAGVLCSSGRLETEEFAQLRLIETNDDIVADANDRHTHLLRHLNHFLALLCVSRYIMFGILDIVGSEKFLGSMAEVADRRTVNYYCFVHMHV